MEMYSMVILAGGLAKRLEPITSVVPKSLIKINGKPFIDIQLELLKKNKFSHVVLCVGHEGDMIRDHVGNGNQFRLNVEYSFDGEKLLGTGGAIKNAFKFLGDDFFVMYGDSYLPIKYKKVQKSFEKQNKLALMTIYENYDKYDKSNIIYRKGKIIHYKKQQTLENLFEHGVLDHIDYGLSILNKLALDKIDKMCYDLSVVFEKMLDLDQLAALEIKSRFYEIGSFKGLDELRRKLS